MKEDPETIRLNIRRHQELLKLSAKAHTHDQVRKLLAEARAQWRQRAGELRATAERFVVPSAQDALLKAAAGYEQLADQAEGLLAGHPAG